MGKVSSKDKETMAAKQKRRLRSSSNKYLRPGALAQIRYNKASAAKSCTDLGKKRVALVDVDKANNDVVLGNKCIHRSPPILSPVKFGFGSAMEKSQTILSPIRSGIVGPFLGAVDIFNLNNLQKTPKTPRAEDCESESRLESLPMDLLVKIMCHLHHDQLRAVFHVSQKIRKAVIQARQFHFNYTTPDRTRQEMLRTITPLPTDCWPFMSKGDGKGVWIPSPQTPKAPKHCPRSPSCIKFKEMQEIAVDLFPESSFPSSCLVPSVLSQPICKSLASNRVLFYEELCQAVAQNKLR
ncbi:hypothetical protein ACH5RR_011897 [Cinchona calisaya]|uniref:F-box domain-containing protein n=1 Tax=Cinchona calisaya TaxID=153742 RepID=A0ABD3A670_9GENT